MMISYVEKFYPKIFIVDDVFDQPGSIADRIELKYNDKYLAYYSY